MRRPPPRSGTGRSGNARRHGAGNRRVSSGAGRRGRGRLGNRRNRSGLACEPGHRLPADARRRMERKRRRRQAGPGGRRERPRRDAPGAPPRNTCHPGRQAGPIRLCGHDRSAFRIATKSGAAVRPRGSCRDPGSRKPFTGRDERQTAPCRRGAAALASGKRRSRFRCPGRGKCRRRFRPAGNAA